MNRPQVVITSKVFGETLDLLGERFKVTANPSVEPWSADELRNHCTRAFGMLAFMHDRICEHFLSHCRNLRVIACALKGHDNIDIAACTRRGIWVTTVTELLSQPTAELAVGLMLGLCRNIKVADQYVRSGLFRGWRPHYYGGTIDNSTVGIVGGGSVGRAIAHKLSGFACRTLVFDKNPAGALPGNSCWAGFDALVEASDFVVLALPLTDLTKHLVNSDFLERMKPSCFLINPARGSLVDEAAVAAALKAGRLAGYAADVFEFEDRGANSHASCIDPGLLAMSDKTLFTAHIGSAIVDVRRRIEQDAARNIIEVWSGNRPHGALNDVACVQAKHA